jgi:hypothetical protein
MSRELALRCAVVLSLAGAALSPASTARAFTEPRSYFDDAARGGGGGRWFTGSPAEGYGCSVCHEGGESERLRITGLPESGYVPGASYDVRVSWSEFAARADRIRARNAGPPSMSLVAEFVTETGEGSGLIEIAAPEVAASGELCIVPENAQAAQLYSVRPGEDTAEQPVACHATGLGQRCVVAVLSCGARELRFRWTAPERWQGVIWFSGGFVATERVSGDPLGDAVTEFSHVLPRAPAPDERYVMRMEGGCRASGSAGHGPGAGWLLVLAWLCVQRSLRGRRARAWLLAAFVLSAGGCRERAEDPRAKSARPLAGLFTPGSTLGALPPAAQSAAPDGGEPGTGLSARELADIESAIDEASGSNRCGREFAAGEGVMASEGRLSVEFETASYGGHYAPKNCGAVWIEDPEGRYVATPLLWAGIRSRTLFVWDARRCRSDRPDAITSATLDEHGKRHSATWDGRDHAGEIVPDGRYVLNIEVTEDEFNYGRRTQISFVKSAMPQTQQPEDDGSVRNLTLSYTPSP